MSAQAVRRRKRKESGVTMIELLVALSLVSIVTLAAGFIYLTNQRSFRQGREKVLAQQNLTCAGHGGWTS
jgi:prepilin-type N-terminal cleavage/methylation domain-containing protein